MAADAPVARLVVCETEKIAEVVGAAAGPTVVVSWSGVKAGVARVVPLPPDAPGYAAGLYAALREADGPRPALIVVERPRMEGDEREMEDVVHDLRHRMSDYVRNIETCAAPATGEFERFRIKHC